MLKNSLWIGTCLVFLSLALHAGAGAGEKGKKGGKDDIEPKYKNTTFVPTADEVISKMFEMAKVNKNDVVFDLGCGDNRIVYKAAKKFGCRGIGIEINPERIHDAMKQYEKYNGGPEFSSFSQLVELRHADALKVKDIGDATVVVMYMFPEFMSLWFPIAEEKLKPGTRILSHDYQWEYDKLPHAWKPAREEIVSSKSGEGYTGRDNHKVIMWIVPEKKGAKREASDK
jgi:Histone methylation protein DOT1